MWADVAMIFGGMLIGWGLGFIAGWLYANRSGRKRMRTTDRAQRLRGQADQRLRDTDECRLERSYKDGKNDFHA